MIIKPITVRLVAYGQKANVAAIRTRAIAFLKDEHGEADLRLFQELSAADAHAEILAKRSETEVELKKSTKSMAGIVITLPEVNERMVGEWLQELPVAKTCVAFATWISFRENTDWQLLMADGARSFASQPHQG